MDDPEQWRWIWMGAAVLFLIGEMASPGSFFLIPFAVGAAVAAVLAFLDVEVAVQWLAFVGLSVVVFAALRPLARRVDVTTAAPGGVGANRLIGELGTIVETIDGAGDEGLVRIHRERWRAESVDAAPIPTDARVRVVDVRGTRLVVAPVDADADPETDADTLPP